jgi:hypothetical protein
MPEILYQRDVSVANGSASPESFTVSVAGSIRPGQPIASLLWSGTGIPQVVLAKGNRNRIIEMAVKFDGRQLKEMADGTLMAAGRGPARAAEGKT